MRRSPPAAANSLKSIAFALVALLLAPFEVLAETESKRAHYGASVTLLWAWLEEPGISISMGF